MKTICLPYSQVDLEREHSARTLTTNGYIVVRCPGHPQAGSCGQVYEHRMVMERHLGRFLRPGEVVHHKNEDTTDNRIENLELTNHVEHQRLHHAGKLERRTRSLEREVVDRRSRGQLVKEIATAVGLCEPTVISVLNRHPIRCGYCGLTFKRQKSLGMHIRRSHRGE